MEKVLIVSIHKAQELRLLLKKLQFRIVNKNPDFIITYGGDGTILFSERKYPGTPKLVIKRSLLCRKYDYNFHEAKNVLHAIRRNEYSITNEIKLETEINGCQLCALNEIQVRAKLPIYALRFSVCLDGKEFSELIGDGIIVATPFGSTGYYKSTGGIKFGEGIGLSFNNLHNKKIESSVLPYETVVTAKILRGPALVVADNNEGFLELKDGEIIKIKKSESVANFMYVEKSKQICINN